MKRLFITGWALLSAGLCLSVQAQDRLHISQINPSVASPGDTIEINGDFGAHQGTKIATIFRVVNHRPLRYIMSVDWSAHRILARLPAGLAPDRYLVFVCYEDRPLWASNKKAVTIRGGRGEGSGDGPRYRVDDDTEKAAISQKAGGRTTTSTVGGMLIERVRPNVTRPGALVDILGIHFGERQAGKIVAINLGHVNRMRARHWSDNRIQARIPPGLAPGRYRLLIYYDGSLRTSSNSLEVIIRDDIRPPR